jgi:hypothetical protein
MRKLAEHWPDSAIVQRTVAQIPWRSNILLMEKIPDEQARLWYAERTIENGWSREILDAMIASRLIERQGKAIGDIGRNTSLRFV